MVRPRDVTFGNTLGCVVEGLGVAVGWLLGVGTDGMIGGVVLDDTLGSGRGNGRVGLAVGVAGGGTLGCEESNVGDGVAVGWTLGAVGLYLNMSCSCRSVAECWVAGIGSMPFCLL